VARRNERARIYTNQARQRAEDQQRELEQELVGFRRFAAIVETAPHMGLLVLRADLHALVLYASEPVQRLLGLRHEAILGQPLWAFLHQRDHARVAAALGDLILTLVAPKKAMACLLRRADAGASKASAKGNAKARKKRGPPAGGPGGEDVVVVQEGREQYVRVTLNVRNGTQGLIVSVWPEPQR
jgi:PAS domain-containing protein